MRLVVISEGSKGLGLALCSAFSERGHRVLEFSRSAPHDYSVSVDLASPAECRRIVATALATLGREPMDEILVINNAGTLDPIGPASRKAEDAVLANLNTNFTSAVLFLAELVEKYQTTPCRKVVVNVTSGAAQKGYAGWSLYCAAKAGMENFIRALAIEQKAEPYPFIAINVDPGVIDTDMQALIRSSSLADFPDVERFIERKKQGVLASPARVAAAILRILELPSLTSGQRYDVSDYGV